MRAVFAFLFSHWRRRPWLAARIGGAMVLATVTEVFVPFEAGRLIDALALGPSGKAAAVTALVTMGLLGFSMIGLRLTALAGIVPFTTRMMSDVAAEAFHRVQRLSTDWHANNFAGSTQRKITRGMWALDTLNDTLLLALLPSLTILIGSVALLTARAPVLGAVMAAARSPIRSPPCCWRRAGSRRRRGCRTSGTRASAGCWPMPSAAMPWSRPSPAKPARTRCWQRRWRAGAAG